MNAEETVSALRANARGECPDGHFIISPDPEQSD